MREIIWKRSRKYSSIWADSLNGTWDTICTLEEGLGAFIAYTASPLGAGYLVVCEYDTGYRQVAHVSLEQLNSLIGEFGDGMDLLEPEPTKTAVGDYKTALYLREGYTLVYNSQDIDDTLQSAGITLHVNKSYPTYLLVKVGDAEYLEVWGYFGRSLMLASDAEFERLA